MTPTPLDVRHLLDAPAGRAVRSGPLVLTGWCFDHGGRELLGLRARLGARTYIARRKQMRPGVAGRHPGCASPDLARQSGFSVEVELDLEQLRAGGDPVLHLEYKAPEGQWQPLARYSCVNWTRLEEPPAPSGLKLKLKQRLGNWLGSRKQELEQAQVQGLVQMQDRMRVRVGILSCGKDEICHLTSLYEALLEEGGFEPCVVVYGIRHPDTGYASDSAPYAEHLRSRGLLVRDRPPEGLDLVLTFLPYEGLLDDEMKQWLRRQRLCYVPYGSLVNYVGYANPFYDRCWRIFVDARQVWEKFAADRGLQWAGERCVVMGLPKLDGFRSQEETPPGYWPRPRSQGVKRVLILDHWTQEWTDPDEGLVRRKGYSQFMKYRDLLLDLPRRYPQVDFVFRPHPLLFDNLKKTGLQTAGEIEAFIREFTAHANARYDQVSLDYILVFKESDCLIAPGISCLVEYLPSLKPVLLLEKGDGHGLNDFGSALVAGHYRAGSAQEMLSFIDQTVVGGSDPLAARRLELMKQHLILPEEGAGRAVVKLLKQAWQDEGLNPAHPSA